MTPRRELLRVSEDLWLQPDYVTKTAAILAQRRKGKTYSASVFAEEMVDLGLPFVALDPTGAWWGLRAAADGKAEGLPVVIIGGKRADVPLERTGGSLVADLVVDHPGYYVLDLSLLESRGAERQFAADFAERLYRRKLQPGMDFPMHLFVDEADMFVPQDREAGDNRMLGAFQSIVRRGGLVGLGCTLISQRPALVNKSVLTQLDVLVLLRLIAGNDQDYVDKNYVSRAGDKDKRAELMESLATLGLGEAWIWEPGEDLFARVQIRQRRTFNSSATPRAGERRVEPKRLAAVDLEAVTAAMAETVERARDSDPAELRARVRELEAALARAREERTPAEPVMIPVLPDHAVAALQELSTNLGGFRDALFELNAVGKPMSEELCALLSSLNEGVQTARFVVDGQPSANGTPEGTVERSGEAEVTSPPRSAPQARGQNRQPSGTGLTAAPEKILAVLAQRPDEALTARRVGWLAGYSSRKSTVRNAVSSLRQAGLIADVGSEIRITSAGLDQMRGRVDPLPSGPELLDHWLREVGDGAPGRILRIMLTDRGRQWTQREIAERTDIDPGTSTLRNALSSLRQRGLVAGMSLDPDFVEAIA